MKTTIIGGGTGKMGMYCSLQLAKLGHKVIVIGRNQLKLDKLKKVKNIITINLDLTNYEEISKIADKIGKIDNIINFTGGTIYGENYISIHGLTSEKMDEVFKLNVICSFNLIKGFYKLINNNGNIINIGSISYKDNLDNIFYSCSKLYLHELTMFLKKEEYYKSKHIGINIIHPGNLTENTKAEFIYKEITKILN